VQNVELIKKRLTFTAKSSIIYIQGEGKRTSQNQIPYLKEIKTMRNISVPTNDMMIFAVHGNTVDECIADCAKLMAYLTKGAQPENDTVDDDDDYNSDDYDDYELDDDDDTVDDDDDERERFLNELIDSIRNGRPFI
jgi:hypothetical protein